MNFNLISKFYRRQDVQFELVKQLYHREFALLIPSWVEDADLVKTSTRTLKCHSVQHLQFILKALEWGSRHLPYNFYYSLARYKDGLPNQDMNMFVRKEKNTEWLRTHERFMDRFDFLVDIDSPNHQKIKLAYNSMVLIHNYFNEMRFPHMVRFSGKGFHLVTPSTYFLPLPFDSGVGANIYNLYSKIARLLKKRFSDLVDTSIYESRRLCKLSYSLSIYKDNIFVCYPLNTEKEIENFSPEDYRAENFGLPIFQHSHHIFNSNSTAIKLLDDLGLFVGVK